MTITVSQNQLQALEQLLQRTLREQTLISELRVQCFVLNQTLKVLTQVKLEASQDPEQLLDRLEIQVRCVPLELLPSSLANNNAISVELQVWAFYQPKPITSRALQLPIELAIAPTTPPQLQTPPVHAEAERAEAHPSETVQAITPRTAIAPKPAEWLMGHWLMAIALGMGAGLLLGGTYVLSRPCVLGECTVLLQADALSQTSLELLQPTATSDEVLMAYDQLVEAIYLVEDIPVWSQHYDAGQQLLQQLETEAEVLAKVVDALEIGRSAAEESQNPPHPLPKWEAIQSLWKEAIALLSSTPADSHIYPLAQHKRTEYEANLVAIEQRLTIENQAQADVRTARSTAQLAETREAIAQKPEDWQLIRATWQTTIQRLNQVPEGTMAYAEAQQLLEIYQMHLTAVSDRLQQEEQSATAYQQAVELAEQAQSAEQEGQWSQAVTQWREALTQIQQVIEGTTFHPRAQPLSATYQSALSIAEENLQKAVTQQTAETSLADFCAGYPTLCTYRFQSDRIQVFITAGYDRAAEQSMVYAQILPNTVAEYQTNLRVNDLLRAIARIGDLTELPVELYNASEKLFGIYEPEFAGYVQSTSP